MEKMFISADELLRDSMELARRVVASGMRPTFLVAMWRGGTPVGIAVQEVLEYYSIHVDHIAIRTSSYAGIDLQHKTVRVHATDYLVSHLEAEDELLIVDDVYDSGRSLEAVMEELTRRCRRNLPQKMHRDGVLQAQAPAQRAAARLLRARDRSLAGLSARAAGTDARGDPGAQARPGELLRPSEARPRHTRPVAHAR